LCAFLLAPDRQRIVINSSEGSDNRKIADAALENAAIVKLGISIKLGKMLAMSLDCNEPHQ
jgi:hypothetical protein